MKVFNLFKKYFVQIREYILAETELIRLRAIRSISLILANIISIMVIMTMFNITLAMAGIWFGFYLSEQLDSLTMGFGISALTYVFILLILIIFRKPLLIKPFINFSIAMMNHKIREENEAAES